jgi:hypothetical protein
MAAEKVRQQIFPLLFFVVVGSGIQDPRMRSGMEDNQNMRSRINILYPQH